MKKNTNGIVVDEELASKLARCDEFSVDLPSATEITNEAAKILSRLDRGWIILDGLKTISATAAGYLSSAGAICLRGLEEIDEDVAAQLARHKCKLVLSGIKVASKSVLEALGTSKADLFLDGLCDAPDEGIRALAGERRFLALDGIREVSDETLEALARSRCREMNLGLTKLSDQQAKLLELFHGDWLNLGSITEISENAAESIARLSVKRLSLPKLQEFSESVATQFSKLKGITLSGSLQISNEAMNKLLPWGNFSSWLSLDGRIELADNLLEIIYSDSVINKRLMHEWIQEDPKYRSNLKGRILTVDAAEYLVECYKKKSSQAKSIDFDLQELPDKIAAILEGYTGILGVKVNRLTAYSASCLAKRKFKRGLTLRLEEIDEAVAAELAKTDGPLTICIEDVPDAAANALLKCKGELRLLGLTRLTSPALAKIGDSLSGNHLTEISDAAAVSLAKHSTYLALDSLVEVSDSLAQALAKHRGHLSLNSLKMLSDAAAEALSTHQHELSLNSLTELSDAAGEALSNYQGTICYKDPAEWVASLRE